MNAITVDENVPSLIASYFVVFGGSQWEAFSFSQGKWGSSKSGGEGRLRRGTGGSGERGSCSWDILHEKRINKKGKRGHEFEGK